MELLGDDRVVAPPSSKRVTEDRWALVGLMRRLLAAFGGCGVASSSLRRVAASSFLSSSRSARSCLNSSSRGADAPAPCCLLVQLQGAQGCPCGVTAWDPCPSSGIRRRRCAQSRAARRSSALELALDCWETDRGATPRDGKAPRARRAEGRATAWVLHNFEPHPHAKRMRRDRVWLYCAEAGHNCAAGIVYIVQPHQVVSPCAPRAL